MHYLISYDIANDKRRNRLLKMLEDYACRIQYSVFEGDFDENILKKIKDWIDYVIDKNEDSVLIFPICNADWKKHLEFGKEIETMKTYESDFLIL